RTVLPDIPDVADELDHLAHAWSRLVPTHRVAALVVTLHLRPEAEHEASAARHLEVPGDLRVDERDPRECDRDVGADDGPLGGGCGHGAGKIRIVPGLRGPEALESQLLR